MYKVGDIVILRKGDADYMNHLIGIPTVITEITSSDDLVFKIYHSKMEGTGYDYFIPADKFDVIPEEVWNSPLYTLMQED